MEQVSVVSSRRSIVGEGPHWDSKINRLIYVDIYNGLISRLNPETKEENVIRFDGDTVSFAVPMADDPDQMVIGRNKQLCQINWNTKEVVSVFAEVEHGAETRFNDGKCDTKGRIWAGTMSFEKGPGIWSPGVGNFYSFNSKTFLKMHMSNITISNGIAWSKDDKKMFYIDSIPGKIYAFEYNAADGSISNEKVLIDFQTNPLYANCGLPDGLTIDVNDNLWVACFNGSRVIQIDPNSGSILKTVMFPASKITSCCFGGSNYDTLYVTSCSKSLDKEEVIHPLAGSVFEVTGLGTHGFPPNNFYA